MPKKTSPSPETKPKRSRAPKLSGPLAEALRVRAIIEGVRSKIPDSFPAVREALDEAYVALAEALYDASLPEDVRQRFYSPAPPAPARTVKENVTHLPLQPQEERLMSPSGNAESWVHVVAEGRDFTVRYLKGVPVGYARGIHKMGQPEPVWRDNRDRLELLHNAAHGISAEPADPEDEAMLADMRRAQQAADDPPWDGEDDEEEGGG